MNKEFNDKVLQEFETYLKEHGVKLTFIAVKLGLASTTLSSWRHGNFFFSVPTLRHIQRYIGIEEEN
ncbi:hypothetical protein BACCIP111899_04146 [Bacillus rhizoplanae]|uniref:XRE family transcriptional regulator n=1 Tax=Bacillus rhizoplanae TaxID=2880966 RepID=A0ABM8YGP5_9BACI|nr:hypothetical protein BACCIP111899_04146 [Bacillus rhizoplanae]